MQVFVKSIDGETLTIEHDTVDGVKHKMEDLEGIPVQYQRLLFEGKELEDGRELSYYKVQDNSTLHLTMKLEGGRGYGSPELSCLAYHYLLDIKICRKCYGRLSPHATRCGKAKCGRTTNIRPKKIWWNFKSCRNLYKQTYERRGTSV